MNEDIYYDTEDIMKNRGGFTALCYLGILWLLPYFKRKESPFVRFHLNQGLSLILLEIAVSILNYVLYFIFNPGLVLGIWGFLYRFTEILILVLIVLGISRAINGQVKPLPFIGGLKILK